MDRCLPGYDEDAALAAALEGSRLEAQQQHVPQRQSILALKDDEDIARAMQESLDLDHQGTASAYTGDVRSAQVCMAVCRNPGCWDPYSSPAFIFCLRMPMQSGKVSMCACALGSTHALACYSIQVS